MFAFRTNTIRYLATFVSSTIDCIGQILVHIATSNNNKSISICVNYDFFFRISDFYEVEEVEPSSVFLESPNADTFTFNQMIHSAVMVLNNM